MNPPTDIKMIEGKTDFEEGYFVVRWNKSNTTGIRCYIVTCSSCDGETIVDGNETEIALYIDSTSVGLFSICAEDVCGNRSPEIDMTIDVGINKGGLVFFHAFTFA